MIFKDSMAIPQMLCRAGLTTDYSVLAGFSKTGWIYYVLYENKKKNYLHEHDVGDDVLPKVASTDAFVKGGGATTTHFGSLWISVTPLFSSGAVLGICCVGLVHGVEVWMDSNLHSPFGISCNTTFLESLSPHQLQILTCWEAFFALGR